MAATAATAATPVPGFLGLATYETQDLKDDLKNAIHKLEDCVQALNVDYQERFNGDKTTKTTKTLEQMCGDVVSQIHWTEHDLRNIYHALLRMERMPLLNQIQPGWVRKDKPDEFVALVIPGGVRMFSDDDPKKTVEYHCDPLNGRWSQWYFNNWATIASQNTLDLEFIAPTAQQSAAQLVRQKKLQQILVPESNSSK